MQKQRPLSAVGLWWRWVLATFVGTAIGNILGIPACILGVLYLSDRLIDLKICHTGFGSLTCPVTTGLISGALVVGAFVGLMQYLVLRRFLRSPAWWIMASTFGWTWIGFAATSLAYTAQFGFVISADGSFAESNIIDRLPVLITNSLWLVLAGLLLGVLQWLILWNGVGNTVAKRRLFWWIVVNVALVFFSAIAIMLIFRGMGSLRGILLFFLGFTPFYATITGATLAKMRLHRQAKVEEAQPALTLNNESSEISESL
ncbi:hypothetical protein [Pseudanabaena sp. ABRG5-3]|uniref:hypothetical protein n=1 Tax=Pseudanabaena sp. ABRG5-3 TaxID=685565 RepID=UPI000DC70AC4|nr:hypothetical protein [Pseudanabaena sp. ABRG5-3]BBC25254.1 hypothetical protein ABRG53_2997 [Pseudanabaena sp. ABRG5-3]